ncbi:MAG TPA: DMT family transporter [Dehalococcoidia bacterium]|jgi:uncharacterized membrane protein YdcZ (DUF606 family)
MTEALYILLAFIVGIGSALQVGMLGEIRGQRGSFEASWINTLGAASALTIAIVVLALTRVDPPDLPSPFDRTLAFVAAAAVALGALAVASRGLDLPLPAVGFFGFSYVLASAFLGPRIGIALYISALTAGTLVGGIGLDHFGAFGSQVIRVDGYKVAGLVCLMLGVVLIRGR